MHVVNRHFMQNSDKLALDTLQYGGITRFVQEEKHCSVVSSKFLKAVN